MIVREEFLELLRTDRTFREDVRRQLLSEDLLALPGKFDHLTELVGQALSLLRETVGVVRDLAQAQQRTEERIGRLDGGMDRVEAALERLTEAQQRTEEELRWVVSWQRGEPDGETGSAMSERSPDELRRSSMAAKGEFLINPKFSGGLPNSCDLS